MAAEPRTWTKRYPVALQREALWGHAARMGQAHDQLASYNDLVTRAIPALLRKHYAIDISCGAGEDERHHALRVTDVWAETASQPLPPVRGQAARSEAMLPTTARESGATYASPFFVNLVYTVTDTSRHPAPVRDVPTSADAADEWAMLPAPLPEGALVSETTFRNVRAFYLPTMMGSVLCHRASAPERSAATECAFDEGGTFYMRGLPRVALPRGDRRFNRLLVTRAKPTASRAANVEAEWRSIRYDAKPSRSTSTLTAVLNASAAHPDAAFTLSVQYLTPKVPASAVFRAIGVHTLARFREAVWQGRDPVPAVARVVDGVWAQSTASDDLEAVMVDVIGADLLKLATAQDAAARSHGLASREDACDAEPRRVRVRRQVRQQLASELLPHLGCDASAATQDKKALALGTLVRRMALVESGAHAPDDVDDISNKSVYMCGAKLTAVIRKHVCDAIRAAHSNVFARVSAAEGVDILAVARTIDSSVTSALLKFFTSGANSRDATTAPDAFLQLVQQVNGISVSSLLRRVHTRMNGHYADGRGVHPSQLAIYDPALTPEHEDTGALLDLAVFAHASPHTPRALLAALLDGVEDWATAAGVIDRDAPVDGLLAPFTSMDDALAAHRAGGGTVLVNGDIYGTTRDAAALCGVLRAARRRGYLPAVCSVVAHHDGAVGVWADGGQLVVPLINLEALKTMTDTKWDDARAAKDAAALRALMKGGRLDPRDAVLADGTCGRDCAACDAYARAVAGGGDEAAADAARRAAHGADVASGTKRSRGVAMRSVAAEDAWSLLLRCGVVEWLSAEEIAQAVRLAFLPAEADACDAARAAAFRDGTFVEDAFTHLAPHPAAMYSTPSAFVPFPNHDQAPRIGYAGHMAGQQIGRSVTNLWTRTPGGDVPRLLPWTYCLWYPQAAVCSSDAIRVTKLDEWPCGESAVFAIMPFRGANGEDAIVRKRDAVDRGMSRFTVGRTFTARAAPKWEEFAHPLAMARAPDGSQLLPPPAARAEIPKRGATLPPKDGEVRWEPPTKNLRAGVRYDKIGADGTPPIGAMLTAGDVIIGVVGRAVELDERGEPRVQRVDRSLVLRCAHREVFVVKSVSVSNRADGSRVVSVYVECTRAHEEGDKAVFPHGQKGVVGRFEKQEDLPFVSGGPNDGVVPDLLINMCSINSRVTIGWLIEMLYSRHGVRRGQFQDATIFRNVSAARILDLMARSGDSVRETLIDGMTGEVLCTDAFVGVGFFGALVHFARGKASARGNGPINPTTMQPAHSTGKEGGAAQKNGVMENDATRAHGVKGVMEDRLEAAGRYSVPVCTACGFTAEEREPTLGALFAAAEGSDNPTMLCRRCGHGRDVVMLRSTYVYLRLLVAYSAIMGVGFKHHLRTDAEVAAHRARRTVRRAAEDAINARDSEASEQEEDDDDVEAEEEADAEADGDDRDNDASL